MKNIFTITTFQKEKKVEGSELTHRASRTVGYMYDKQEAIRLVESNACDLNEAGYYPYALVEEVPEGLYAMSRDLPFKDRVTWFKWNEKTESYEITDKCPKGYERLVNLSLG